MFEMKSKADYSAAQKILFKDLCQLGELKGNGFNGFSLLKYFCVKRDGAYYFISEIDGNDRMSIKSKSKELLQELFNEAVGNFGR